VKRWTFAILLFLLLGAIVNVAVAWGCQYRHEWFTWGEEWHLEPALAEELLLKWGGGLAADEHLEVDCDRSLGCTGIHIAGEPPSEVDVSWCEYFSIWRAGWPLRSLEGAEYGEEGVRGDEWVQPRIIMLWSPFGLEEDWPFRVPTYLPLQPIWSGFLINTILYAALLWLLIAGPFVLRRLIRLKRGRCPKCGYDLRGQPPEVGAAGCPECGWNRQPEATA